MALTESTDGWCGESFADLEQFLRELAGTEYPVEIVVQSVCVCGAVTFILWVDEAVSCVQRRCAACRHRSFLADSSEWWEEAEPEQVACACGHKRFDVAVGFSMRATEPTEVKWINVGVRCAKCGQCGLAADWKIDYSPSQHLLSLA